MIDEKRKYIIALHEAKRWRSRSDRRTSLENDAFGLGFERPHLDRLHYASAEAACYSGIPAEWLYEIALEWCNKMVRDGTLDTEGAVKKHEEDVLGKERRTG